MNRIGEKYKIIIIAALSENNVIGVNNKLPWYIPEDLKRFKAITEGHTLIMGRKTFQSIGKPLENRFNIVLSNTIKSNQVKVSSSLEEAFSLVPEDEDQVFICGGEKVFKEALAYADIMQLTIVEGTYKGDAHFPDFNENEWLLVALSQLGECKFVTLTRMKNESSS